MRARGQPPPTVKRSGSLVGSVGGAATTSGGGGGGATSMPRRSSSYQSIGPLASGGSVVPMSVFSFGGSHGSPAPLPPRPHGGVTEAQSPRSKNHVGVGFGMAVEGRFSASTAAHTRRDVRQPSPKYRMSALPTSLAQRPPSASRERASSTSGRSSSSARRRSGDEWSVRQRC